MDDKEMIQQLIDSCDAYSEPIDFEKLLKQGLLVKKGNSYYVPDMKALPEKVAMRINTASHTKNGIRVTFYKERKSAQKVAERARALLKE